MCAKMKIMSVQCLGANLPTWHRLLYEYLLCVYVYAHAVCALCTLRIFIPDLSVVCVRTRKLHRHVECSTFCRSLDGKGRICNSTCCLNMNVFVIIYALWTWWFVPCVHIYIHNFVENSVSVKQIDILLFYLQTTSV